MTQLRLLYGISFYLVVSSDGIWPYSMVLVWTKMLRQCVYMQPSPSPVVTERVSHTDEAGLDMPRPSIHDISQEIISHVAMETLLPTCGVPQ